MQTPQPFRPKYPVPPISSSYQPYVPAQLAPRQLLTCFYCVEEGNSTVRCNHLTEDLEKKIVLRHGGTYLFPNFEIVPSEGPTSEKELVKQFSKEQEEFTKQKMQTRKGIARQESQSQTQQEDKNETHKPFKKKIPGDYHGEDKAEEEIRVLIPKKYKKAHEGKEVDNENIKIIYKNKNKEVLRQDSQKMELKNKVKSTANTPKLIIEHVMKKILEQKTNLTLKEIL
ncbi:hypothetical protein O181_066997 [Austropuccinia psidii MF-1]|uniref:Uncharacterized protein n=1 Tax=Austropuccinia psidii MF-1 TaxID=1389203 RepID=A0A9Q3EZZ6_9BASI|nr:hypothetical protein [Austropuccinia psidii MF-1]